MRERVTVRSLTESRRADYRAVAGKSFLSMMKHTIKLIALSALLLLSASVVKADQSGDFTYTSDGTNVTITGYTGNNFTATIPDTINGLPVTSIGNGVFYYYNCITNITIPSSVTNIGQHVFAGCAALKSITIPNGVVSIGDMAFYYCSSLTSINLPNGVANIGDQTFYYCSSLSSITIGTNVTHIGNETFRNCANLTSLAPLSNVTSIGYDAFFDCTNLANISIPGSVTNIGIYAFYNCASLTSFIIPTNITSIKMGTFEACGKLTNVTIPNSVNNIEDEAFYFSGLTSITIPINVTNIGNAALCYCSSLNTITVDSNNPAFSSMAGVLFDKNQTTLIQFPGGKGGDYTIPNSVTNINGGAFWSCFNLTNIAIGTNTTSIPGGLFEHCTNLISITIPNSVTSIGIFAFLGCSSLTSVTIPNGVTTIGRQAFSYCPSLTGIYFAGNAPTNVGSDTFGATVYFLPGTTGWENFAQLTDATTVLWNPQAQTSDGSFGVRTNKFGFNITGTTNIPIVVEACTNLSGAWVPLQSASLTNGLLYFSDPDSTNYPARYYRIRSP